MSAEAPRHSDWSSYWRKFSDGQTPATTLLDPEFVDTIKETDRVLDLGCGFGRNTVTLAERAESVVGIDINAQEIAFAALNNAASNISYEVMSGTDLKFSPELFDKVVMSGVLGGVALGMRHDILDQVQLVTRQHGSLYVSEYAMKHDAPYSAEMYEHGQEVTGEYGAVTVYEKVGIGDQIKFIGKHFDPDELAALLAQHGFTDPTIHTSTIERKPLFESEGPTYTSNMVSMWAQKQ